MTIARPSLVCFLCGEKIVKKRTDAYDHRFDVSGSSQIEKAWHRSCEPSAIPPDSPFRAALQKAGQSIEDARRLGPDVYLDFCAIVRLALTEQR